MCRLDPARRHPRAQRPAARRCPTCWWCSLGAAAIALAEELAFRGVVQHWLARTTGEWPAVVVQGVAYGLWVAAVGWGPLVGILAVGAGLVAGVITMRTNSILTVLAWHAGIAVPLFAVMVCQ